MNHLFAIISIGATLALIMMGGIGVTASHTTQEAIALSNIDNNNTTTLGNPFFVEKGRIIGQRVLSVSPQPQLEFTVVANATINGNISATNIGTTIGYLFNLMEYFVPQVKGLLRRKMAKLQLIPVKWWET